MKNLVIFLSFCCFAAFLPAQPSIEWQKVLGGSYFDQALCIEQTSDGGYIVTGNVASTNGDVVGNHGGNDFWVVKLNSSGSTQWTKTLGGSSNDRPYTIHQTSDGGYILAGSTQSNDGDVSGNHGDIDGWIVKLNNNGAIEWQKAFGGSGWDEAWSVRQTTDGGYIVAGRSSSIDGDVTANHGALDFWVVKLDNVGTIQWQKSLGGSNEDIAYSIRQTADGGYIVAGETSSNNGDVSGNHGNIDFWIVKLTSIGDLEWQKTLGGNNGDTPSDIHQTDDGGFVVVGYVGSHNSGDVTGHSDLGLFDFWVVKLSDTGELQWQKALGGTDTDWGRAIAPLIDGGFMVFGATTSTDGDVIGNDGGADFWLIKLSNTGELIWQKTLGGTQADLGFSLQQTSDNGYILAGYAWSNDGDVSGVHGYNDFWVVKLSPESVATHEAHNTQTSHLEIFPNPAWQSFTINTSSEDAMIHVTVSDLLGQELLHETIQNGGNISASSLPNGLYLVVAKDQSGRVFTGTLRKES